jgi:hypothetical protein
MLSQQELANKFNDGESVSNVEAGILFPDAFKVVNYNAIEAGSRRDFNKPQFWQFAVSNDSLVARVWYDYIGEDHNQNRACFFIWSGFLWT